MSPASSWSSTGQFNSPTLSPPPTSLTHSPITPLQSLLSQPWCADRVLHVSLLPLDPVPGVPTPGPPELPAALAARPDHLLHGPLHRDHHPLQWSHSCHGRGSCAQAPHTAGYGNTFNPSTLQSHAPFSSSSLNPPLTRVSPSPWA